MISEIFLPMFYMMLLTLIVFSLSLSLRLKEIYLDKKVPGEEQRHPPFDQGSIYSRMRKETYQTYLNFQSFSMRFASAFISQTVLMSYLLHWLIGFFISELYIPFIIYFSIS